MSGNSKRPNNVKDSSARKRRKIEFDSSSDESSSYSEMESSDDEEWVKHSRVPQGIKTRSMYKKEGLTPAKDDPEELSEESGESSEEADYLDYFEKKYCIDEDDVSYTPPSVSNLPQGTKLSNEAKTAIDGIMETMIDTAHEQQNLARNRMHQSQWKKGLPLKKISELQKIYDSVAKNINYVPSVADILESPIPLNEKSNIVERLYILNNLRRDTFEYMQARNYLVAELDKFKSYEVRQADYDYYESLDKKMDEPSENLPIKFQIFKSGLSPHNKQVVYKKYKTYADMGPHNHGKDDLKKWLKSAISIPNNIRKNKLEDSSDADINLHLVQVKEALDAEIYGMESTKEQILSELHKKAKSKNTKGSVLGLTGPPGTGKTSIVNILARVVDIPVVKVSLNGVKDVAKLKGHSFTYISSVMGDIARALIEAFTPQHLSSNKFPRKIKRV